MDLRMPAMPLYSNSGGVEMATDKKIKSFLKLDKGWHFGSGGPANETAVEVALRADFLQKIWI